jgi:GT2 family glycosyltransferase
MTGAPVAGPARVAVVIVTWNASRLVDGVLAALERQTLPPEGVLVVDNGSEDAQQLAAITAAHGGCKLLALPDNLGFAAANNRGIAQFPGAEFIALLNPDAYPEPDWLAELVAAARRHPEAASFASRLLDYRDPRCLDGAGDTLSLAGKPARRGHGMAAAGRFLGDEEVFAPCAAAALYRRAPMEACGGFDERFFCYVEDLDLGFRLRLAGWGCRYVPTAVARHIGSALTGRRSEFSVYHGQRNLIFNYVKNMPAPLLWGLLPLHLLLNLAYLAGATATGRGDAVWRAKRDAICALPTVWRDRRRVQAERRVGSMAILRRLRWGIP